MKASPPKRGMGAPESGVGTKKAAPRATGAGAGAQERAPRSYVRKSDVVLEAAERAFLQSGFAATSMDMVADLAGVSKRTVYSNFGNKVELFAAVIRKRCASAVPKALDAIDMAAADPEPVLIALATNFLTNIFARPQVELYQTVVAESRQFPEIGKIMVEGPITQSQNTFDQFLRAQADLGNLDFPDIDLAAPQLIALLKTSTHLRLLFNQAAPTSKREIITSATASVRLFLNGASTRPKPT